MAVMASYKAVPERLTAIPNGRKKETMLSDRPIVLADSMAMGRAPAELLVPIARARD